MSFSSSYDFQTHASDCNPEPSPIGAWDFGIYCAIMDLMRLSEFCNDQTYTLARTAAHAYKDAYPEIYAEAAQSFYEWRHNL